MPRHLVRQVLVATIALTAVALVCDARSRAQDFPTRIITIVVGVAPGGIHDVSTRIYAETVSRSIGQKIVVENRPAGGGAIAAAAVQNAPPDGHTLLSFAGAQHAAVAAIQSAPYEPVAGFQPVTLLFRLPVVVVVPAASPAHTVGELLALGKTKPGGLSFGSPGLGTPSHLLAAKIGLATNTPMAFVHYRGGAPLMADLITGRVDFALSSYTSARSNVEGRQLKVLAIDAPARWSTMPEVPTLTEAGLGEQRIADWFALAAPAGTPPAVVRKLNAEFGRAARDPDLIRRLTDNGTLIATSTPDEMRVLMVDAARDIEQLVKTLGLRAR